MKLTKELLEDLKGKIIKSVYSEEEYPHDKIIIEFTDDTKFVIEYDWIYEITLQN